MSTISENADFGLIRYANCWEDADVVVDALGAKARGGRVLSIASAGDNVLALLSQVPEQVVAVDLSLAQLACLELRMAAFKELEYEDLLTFLGVKPAQNRASTYQALRRGLSTRTRGFWDQHQHAITGGVIHAGKFENYFRLLRALLSVTHRSHRIEGLLKNRTQAERRSYFTQQWNTWIWRVSARIFFSQTFMGRFGRDPAFFEHVDGSVADHVLRRAEYAVTELDASNNPYLQYILTGNFSNALPLYLRPERFRQIRDGLACIKIHQGDLTSVTARLGKFDALNLSDVFEYMDTSTFAHTAQWLAQVTDNDASLVYWNMLVPRDLARERPEDFACRSESTAECARNDKAFFYSQLHIDQRCRR